MPSLSLSRYRFIFHFFFHFFSHHRKPTQSEMVHEKSILFSCRLFLWGKDPRKKKNSLLLILMFICREASYNFIFYPPILAHASVCAQIPLLIRQLVNRKKFYDTVVPACIITVSYIRGRCVHVRKISLSVTCLILKCEW